MNVLRNSLVAAGAMLLVVGSGNLYVASGNITKYTAILADRQLETPAAPSPDFPRLDARMTEDVLRPLRHGSGGDEHAVFKLEFYRVVQQGGYVMNTVGVGCVGIGLLAERVRRRRALAAA
mgnify:FL=1